jgi:hypothetical protein
MYDNIRVDAQDGEGHAKNSARIADRRGEASDDSCQLRQCELCGERARMGKYLGTVPGQPSIWACDDCQRMLLIRVDDKGTPGD